ncbi:hypothetical protein P167DRAFT_545564 [Morchella conica CCBAS932]|uniref:Uncharacterized protein n=1 Tax=Morchella conica CCBAS932 TaxID=1392247 RepID=A0A3N4KSF3_9PEZI|nr:hypothetical protein P167DRAFT_545564 [Morchella conica CCBAS932]
MSSNSATRPVFPEFNLPPTGHPPGTRDTATQTTPPESTSPTASKGDSPLQPQQSEPYTTVELHNGTLASNSPSTATAAGNETWPPPPELAELDELLCPVPRCTETFMRGDSKALMDHLRGYWTRVEEVRRRGVRPGVFEEAHAVAYYLESSLDEERQDGGVRRREDEEEERRGREAWEGEVDGADERG